MTVLLGYEFGFFILPLFTRIKKYILSNIFKKLTQTTGYVDLL